MVYDARFLIVGQAPARSAGPWTRPWDSDSGRRLAKMMGISHELMMATFETTNLNPELLGTRGKYDVFDTEIAEKWAKVLRPQSMCYDLVLCCGIKVCALMEAKPLEFRRKTRWTRSVLTGIPHPGGTNRWWNDPKHREVGEAHCREVWRRVDALRDVRSPVRGSGDPLGEVG